jgi:hypothetical protein
VATNQTNTRYGMEDVDEDCVTTTTTTTTTKVSSNNNNNNNKSEQPDTTLSPMHRWRRAPLPATTESLSFPIVCVRSVCEREREREREREAGEREREREKRLMDNTLLTVMRRARNASTNASLEMPNA